MAGTAVHLAALEAHNLHFQPALQEDHGLPMVSLLEQPNSIELAMVRLLEQPNNIETPDQGVLWKAWRGTFECT